MSTTTRRGGEKNDKQKTTKRTLLGSVLSLVICLTMLIGTTFAWFTDSVTSTGNIIQAGTLKIDLLVKDDAGKYQSIKDSKAAIFNYDLSTDKINHLLCRCVPK